MSCAGRPFCSTFIYVYTKKKAFVGLRRHTSWSHKRQWQLDLADGIRRSGIGEVWNDGSSLAPSATLKNLDNSWMHPSRANKSKKHADFGLSLRSGVSLQGNISKKYPALMQMPSSTWTLIGDTDSLFHTYSYRQTTTLKEP